MAEGTSQTSGGDESQGACFPGSFLSSCWPLGFSALGIAYCSSAFFLPKFTSGFLTLEKVCQVFQALLSLRGGLGGSRGLVLATDVAWGFAGWGSSTLVGLRVLGGLFDCERKAQSEADEGWTETAWCPQEAHLCLLTAVCGAHMGDSLKGPRGC